MMGGYGGSEEPMGYGGMMGSGMGSYSNVIMEGGYPGEPNETKEEIPNDRD
jgi:hypothetical protein